MGRQLGQFSLGGWLHCGMWQNCRPNLQYYEAKLLSNYFNFKHLTARSLCSVYHHHHHYYYLYLLLLATYLLLATTYYYYYLHVWWLQSMFFCIQSISSIHDSFHYPLSHLADEFISFSSSASCHTEQSTTGPLPQNMSNPSLLSLR